MSHQAVGWALHALEPDEEGAFPEHLSTCDLCRRTVRETEQTLAFLGADVEQAEPPASLHAGIMDLVARTPQDPRPSPLPARPEPRPHRLVAQEAAGPRPVRRFGLGPRGRRIVAAKVGVAAALAIVVLGIQNAQLGAERDATTAQAAGLTELVRELGQPGTEHAILATPDGATAAAVVLNGDVPQVYSLGLPANDADHTYVLWGIADGSGPAPLGAFDVIPSSPSAVSVGSPSQAGYAQYAISIEPGRIAPASPTIVVASGQVAL